MFGFVQDFNSDDVVNVEGPSASYTYRPPPEVGSIVDVIVTFAQDPDHIYLRLGHSPEYEWTKELNASYLNTRGKVGERLKMPDCFLRVGQMCVAPFEGQLYRSEIIEVNSDFVLIYFVDYGNVAMVSRSDVCFLKQEFSKHSVDCYEARLNGIRPKGDSPSWGAEAVDYFLRQALDEGAQFRAKVISMEEETRKATLDLRDAARDYRSVARSMVENGFAEGCLGSEFENLMSELHHQDSFLVRETVVDSPLSPAHVIRLGAESFLAEAELIFLLTKTFDLLTLRRIADSAGVRSRREEGPSGKELSRYLSQRGVAGYREGEPFEDGNVVGIYYLSDIVAILEIFGDDSPYREYRAALETIVESEASTNPEMDETIFQSDFEENNEDICYDEVDVNHDDDGNDDGELEIICLDETTDDNHLISTKTSTEETRTDRQETTKIKTSSIIEAGMESPAKPVAPTLAPLVVCVECRYHILELIQLKATRLRRKRDLLLKTNDSSRFVNLSILAEDQRQLIVEIEALINELSQ